MSTDWFSGVFAVVLGGLLISAITGNVIMYRQLGELRAAVKHFGEAVQAVAESQERGRQEIREDNRALHQRIDILAKRGSRLKPGA